MNPTIVVASYAALVSSAGLLWQIHTYRKSTRTWMTVELSSRRIQEQDETESWVVTIELVNLSERDVRIIRLALGNRGDGPDYVRTERSWTGPTVPARDSGTMLVTFDELFESGVNVDLEIWAEVQISTRESARSKPFRIGMERHLITALEAEGGSIVDPAGDALAIALDLTNKSMVDTTMAELTSLGEIEAYRARDGELIGFRFLTDSPRDPRAIDLMNALPDMVKGHIEELDDLGQAEIFRSGGGDLLGYTYLTEDTENAHLPSSEIMDRLCEQGLIEWFDDGDMHGFR